MKEKGKEQLLGIIAKATPTKLEQLNAEQEKLVKVAGDKENEYKQKQSQMRGRDAYVHSKYEDGL